MRFFSSPAYPGEILVIQPHQGGYVSYAWHVSEGIFLILGVSGLRLFSFPAHQGHFSQQIRTRDFSHPRHIRSEIVFTHSTAGIGFLISFISGMRFFSDPLYIRDDLFFPWYTSDEAVLIPTYQGYISTSLHMWDLSFPLTVHQR